jgi:hypothetical protein
MRVSLRPLVRATIPTPVFRLVHGSKRSRARFAILVGLLVLMLAQLGLGVVVETAKPEWRDPEYGHRIKQLRQLKSEHPDRPLVVALGSSRTLMGFSPKHMNGDTVVYNFGQTGAGPLQLLLTLLRILDDGVKPDAVLIELFPAALVGNGPAEEMIEAWGPRWNHGDVQRLTPYANDSLKLEREWLHHRVAPWFSLRFPLMNHVRPDWLPTTRRQDFQWMNMDSRGWLAYPVEQVPDADRARLTAKAGESYRTQLANYAIGAMSDRALRDAVERCRKEGIRVAFFLMPEGPAFASWYPPGAEKRFRDYAATLHAPVFDSSAGFVESEFADSHHLLPAGAARFSRKLESEHLMDWFNRHE